MKCSGAKVLLGSALLVPLLCAPGHLHAGQAPGAFVDIGLGARPAGMGCAFAAVADDVNSLFWNPAGLGRLEHKQLLFAHLKQFDLVPYTCGAFGTPVARGQAIGVGLLTAGDAVMREHTVLFGYSRALGGGPDGMSSVGAGATVKLRISTFGGDAAGGEHRVTGHALGVAFDVGGRARLTDFLSAGLVVKDLLAPVQWSSSVKGGYIETVPRTVQTGISLGTPGRMVVAVDLENADVLRIGAEATLLDVVRVRGGYCWPLSTEWDKSYAMGCGLGQLFNNGYALGADISLSFEELATTSRFALTVGF